MSKENYKQISNILCFRSIYVVFQGNLIVKVTSFEHNILITNFFLIKKVVHSHIYIYIYIYIYINILEVNNFQNKFLHRTTFNIVNS